MVTPSLSVTIERRLRPHRYRPANNRLVREFSRCPAHRIGSSLKSELLGVAGTHGSRLDPRVDLRAVPLGSDGSGFVPVGWASWKTLRKALRSELSGLVGSRIWSKLLQTERPPLAAAVRTYRHGQSVVTQCTPGCSAFRPSDPERGRSICPRTSRQKSPTFLHDSCRSTAAAFARAVASVTRSHSLQVRRFRFFETPGKRSAKRVSMPFFSANGPQGVMSRARARGGLSFADASRNFPLLPFS